MKIVKIKKFIVSFLILALSAPAYCGDSEGPVKRYLVIIQGKVFFSAGAATSRPACNTTDEWAIDLVGTNAAIGRAMLAVIMSAHASGKNVHVYGTGKCDVWGDRETATGVIALEN